MNRRSLFQMLVAAPIAAATGWPFLARRVSKDTISRPMSGLFFDHETGGVEFEKAKKALEKDLHRQFAAEYCSDVQDPAKGPLSLISSDDQG